MIVNNCLRLDFLTVLLLFHLHVKPISTIGWNHFLTEMEEVAKKGANKRDTTNSEASIIWCYQKAGCKQGAAGSGWEEGLCKNGKSQSPINIDPEEVSLTQDPNFLFLPTEHNNITKFILAASGGKITLTPIWNDGGPTNNNTIGFARYGQNYSLDHLEFHWGPYDDVGSEHAIAGISASMEMHVVYRNTKFGSYEEALSSDEEAAIAIVAVLLVADPNKKRGSKMSPIVSNLDHLAKSYDGTVVVEGNKTFDLKAFMPSSSQVFSYNGSVTSPPCEEVVLWFLHRARTHIKTSDVEAFRHAVKGQDGKWVKMNYRKLQPLDARPVELVGVA